MEARRRATYEDLLQVSDTKTAELIDGELHVAPRPAPVHAHVHTWLGADLHQAFGRGRGGPGGWRILIEPELHLGDDVLVPDLAGWRLQRLPALPETAWFDTPPDWVCEIASPSTVRIDRLVKMEIYGNAGIPWAWLVDPGGRLIEVWKRVDGAWTLQGGASQESGARLPPFHAVPLDIGSLWPDAPPPEER